ncbi:TP901-1 family phage major tail protein [Bradyrhizobium sp. LB8.2]|uniref:phage major tail protein, TP901-1 family n=1 Tax=unclassified Bradyrhizobium TaxID=2631580 RepID=UPI00339B85F5
MPAIKGRNVLLKYYNGTAFVAVGGARQADLSINNEPVDITNSDDAGIRKLLEGAGVTSITIKFQGVYVEDAAATAMLTDAMVNAHRNYQFVLGGKTFTGSFMITSFNPTTTYNGAAANSLNLESAGAVVLS